MTNFRKSATSHVREETSEREIELQWIVHVCTLWRSTRTYTCTQPVSKDSVQTHNFVLLSSKESSDYIHTNSLTVFKDRKMFFKGTYIPS